MRLNPHHLASHQRIRTRGAVWFLTGAFCFVLAACGFALRAPGPESHRVNPGTYSIDICRGSCSSRDPETLLADGRLVLEASAYTSSVLPAKARDYFEEWVLLLLGAVAKDRPNACFVLNRLRSGEGSYAGIEKVGLTLWEPHRADSVRVALYQSPDASYYAILRPTDGELRGRGHSYGYADAAVNGPQDSVYAHRIGPPDRSICIRAAEAEAAALEAGRHPPRP